MDLNITRGFSAKEAILKGQAVALDANGLGVVADTPASASELAFGVCIEDVAAGGRGEAIVRGEAFAIVGAAGLAAGVMDLMVAAGGTVVQFAAAGPNQKIGYWLRSETQPTAAAGDLVRIIVNPSFESNS